MARVFERKVRLARSVVPYVGLTFVASPASGQPLAEQCGAAAAAPRMLLTAARSAADVPPSVLVRLPSRLGRRAESIARSSGASRSWAALRRGGACYNYTTSFARTKDRLLGNTFLAFQRREFFFEFNDLLLSFLRHRAAKSALNDQIAA